MLHGNRDLIQFIRDQIARQGPVTFKWFMGQALYHPELGYYSSGRCSIGRDGDYFTNVSVGRLFGRLLASQFSEIWDKLGCPSDFVIVEQGAQNGDFARDVLEAIRDGKPDLFSVLRYWIIEPFPILQERQTAALQPFADRVSWTNAPDDLAPFSGVHFSNELLDSMPVHLISRCENGWQEMRVNVMEDEFCFVTSAIDDPDLRLHVNAIPFPPDYEYQTEVNLAALKWIETISEKLVRGYVFTIDYGYSRDEYYAPERTHGTLRSCANHRILPSPFSAVGYADLTAHVDWTSVALKAEQCGFAVTGFTDQHHFITGIVTTLLADQFGPEAENKSRRALQTLLHPELLGRTFQVLGLGKDVPRDEALSGFRFMQKSPVSGCGD